MKLLERADPEGPSPELGERTAAGLRPWLVAWLGLPVLGIANGQVWAAVPLWTLLGPEVIRRLRARR